MKKILVVISVFCALILNFKTACAYRNGNQNSQQVNNWQQGRQYAGRPDASYGKANYHNHYATSTVRPFNGFQTTTKRNFYAPAASKAPFVAQKTTTKPPYAQYVPLITASPYSAQSNYGYVPSKLSSSKKAVILKQEYERRPDGGYRFFYETSDGQSREEVGFFREDPRLGKILTVHGSYGYIAPNNKKIFVKYIADENGYRTQTLKHPPVHLPSNVINQQLGFLKN